MKPTSVMGLIMVLLLAALFVYVVQDVPAFGDYNSPANKYIKLFSIDADGLLVESLDEGVVPAEIKNEIERIGFNKENNYPTLEEGEYVIEKNSGVFATEGGGWDVLINEGEIYFKEPIKYYFIKEVKGNLTVYRYNWPVRVIEKTEEETATMNAVTSGLADYRGYDTMFEETVIFSGAVSVILLLRRRGRL
ncbi:MAG: hypothetical protein WAV32_10565 [Halobacteriota archaeon]